MKLLDRLRSPRTEERSGLLLDPYAAFNFNGHLNALGLNTTISQKYEQVDGTLAGYMQVLRASPPAFGAQMVRATVLSQARFRFRNYRDRKMFGTTALNVLDTPWPNGTTGELITKLEWHAGVVGNAYAVKRPDNTIKVLNPDWVSILLGSRTDADNPAWQLDAEVVAYLYHPGGPYRGVATTLMPEQVAHWSPLPDPEASYRGMSWVTPAIREAQADAGYTEHKIKFLENGATPNLVVSGIAAPTQAQFDDLVAGLNSQHEGIANAYRTLYLSQGLDVSVVGSNMAQMDFKSVQGAGETRLSVLSRVPAPILGISEGLAGSSLNAGNFGQARRNWADTWIYPTLQSLAQALAPLVEAPKDGELWPDTGDMPILREDAKDATEIEQLKANTIRTLVDSGFDPDSVVTAVQAQDMSMLTHTGKLSVQLHTPGGSE